MIPFRTGVKMGYQNLGPAPLGPPKITNKTVKIEIKFGEKLGVFALLDGCWDLGGIFGHFVDI